ncbi:hypothetical protein ACP70R_029023 [Stipagrostis hirtigluma subsp. patula]
MVDMEKREKKLVTGLTRRHVIRSGCSSSSPPAASACEGGEHNAALRQKKLKAKASKWKSNNNDLDGKAQAGESSGDYGDTVFSSLTTASFSGLISRKRMRTLGKVAEHCDAVDPPVPRKLRSAINKRVGRVVSASSRHSKKEKRRHLSAISAQISSIDRETRFKESSLFTEEEEVIADTLLSLSQMDDKDVADISNINIASTSYSEGVTKEGGEIIILPSAASELASQPACLDEPVQRTDSVPHANPVPGATDQTDNINTYPPVSDNKQIQDLSLGIVTKVPSPSKDLSNDSARKQLKVQFDGSQSYPAQKPEAPLLLVTPTKSDNAKHERETAKNSSAQEVSPLVQTPLPCTPDGNLIKPSSSKLAAPTSTISVTCKVRASGNHSKLSLAKNVGPTKTWKRSITHVYVSHVIQMHLNKEKASQNQAIPEERSHITTSSSPNGSTFHKNNAQDETCYAVHYDVWLPVQPSTGISDMTAGQQKMVSGNYLNLPTSNAMPGPQHVQYLHPQIAPRTAMSYPFPHLPYTRGDLAPAAAVQQVPNFSIHVQSGIRFGSGSSTWPSFKLISHDEASAAHANSTAAADVAVPCPSVPSTGGCFATGGMAEHVVPASDVHASPADDAATADGALLLAVPGRRRQTATAAQADLVQCCV